jgi:hypothetical protein
MFQIIFIHFDLMFEWSGNYCVLIYLMHLLRAPAYTAAHGFHRCPRPERRPARTDF